LITRLESKADEMNLYEVRKMSLVAKSYFANFALKHSDVYSSRTLNSLAMSLAEENKESFEPLIKKFILCSNIKNTNDEMSSAALAYYFINHSNVEMLKFCIDNNYFKLDSKKLYINTTLNINKLIDESICQYLIDLAPNEAIKDELIVFALVNNHTSLAQTYITDNTKYGTYYLELHKVNKNKNYLDKSTFDYLLNQVYKTNPNELIKIEQYALEFGSKEMINELNILKEHQKLNDLFTTEKEDKPPIKKRKL
jgi:hypothetical protein